MQSLLAEIQVLKEKNEILQDLHTHSTSQYKSLMIKYEDQSSKHKMKEEQLRQQHETEIADLMRLLETAKSDNDALRQQNAALCQTVNDDETRYRFLEHKCDRKQQEVNLLCSKLDSMQSDIVELKSKLYCLSTVNNLQNELIDDLQEKVEIDAARKYSVSPSNKAKNRTLRIHCNESGNLLMPPLAPNMKSSGYSKSEPFGNIDASIDCFLVNSGSGTFYETSLTPSEAMRTKQKSAVSAHAITPTFERSRYRTNRIWSIDRERIQ